MASVLDVKEADRLAVLLKFVLDLAGESQRLRTGQVEAGILKLIPLKARAVEYGYGNQADGFGMARFTGPFEDGDGAQLGRVLAGFGHLAGGLGGGGQGGGGQEDR